MRILWDWRSWLWLPWVVTKTWKIRVFIAFQPFGVSPASGTVHIRVGSGREADGTSDQLLIWFGSLVASLGALQVKVGLKGVFQLGQFAHWAVLAEISVWAWPWGLSILVGRWLGGSLHLGLSSCFFIVSPTKWTKLPYIAMDFYSLWVLVVSTNEMYSWALINIYDRFWVLISMGFK